MARKQLSSKDTASYFPPGGDVFTRLSSEGAVLPTERAQETAYRHIKGRLLLRIQPNYHCVDFYDDVVSTNKNSSTQAAAQ